MEMILYFLCAGILGASILLMLDTQQSRRVNKVLKETKKVQPLFMLRSAEQKLSTLNTLLYSNAPVHNGKRTIMLDEDVRQMMSADLGELINSHKTGKINLKTYHAELNHLVNEAYAMKGMKFERVKVSPNLPV